MSSKIGSAWIVPLSDGRAKSVLEYGFATAYPTQKPLSYSRQNHHRLEQRVDFIHAQRIITDMFNVQMNTRHAQFD
jgi:hypothetical protein